MQQDHGPAVPGDRDVQIDPVAPDASVSHLIMSTTSSGQITGGIRCESWGQARSAENTKDTKDRKRIPLMAVVPRGWRSQPMDGAKQRHESAISQTLGHSRVHRFAPPPAGLRPARGTRVTDFHSHIQGRTRREMLFVVAIVSLVAYIRVQP